MKIAAAGDRALLATFDDAAPAALRARASAVRAHDDVLACVVGHSSLLAVFRGEPHRDVFDADAGAASDAPREHAIEVAFDGADLDEFLASAGLSREAFVRRVRDVRLVVRYHGFRAGFAYLDGWPEEWRMPRRATSRTRVPRGSFAIAGTMAGFYPDDSPGGWNLLGTTDSVLWDESRTPPALFAPGDEIRIVPVDRVAYVAPPTKQRTLAMPGVEIVRPGQLTTIVGARDWSRAAFGATPGGPFDPLAAALANRAAGNAPDAPLFECVLVGPQLRFAQTTRVAIFDQSLRVDEVDAIDVGRLRGFRAWIACGSGGVAPQVVRDGDPKIIQVWRGPHDAAFPEELECVVTPKLDRVGIKVTPLAPLPPAPADLPSIGVQFGSVQQHPDGTLVLMGPDHPVTGGYLQPVTVLSSEWWKLAQLAPGERITLRTSSPRVP